jgi:hypothetical protein
MDARTKAGFWLVYLAWVPMIIWQSSPEWAARVIGESTYKAVAATPAVDVISWVWFVGAFAAGFYLVFGLDAVSFFRRLLRKRQGPGAR